MRDKFNNYSEQEFRKEELLALVASKLELDESRISKMTSAYQAVNGVFDKDEQFFKNYNVYVYPQGSLLLGTTIKPIANNEFDLDIVLRVDDSYQNHTPKEIYYQVYQVLANHGTYSPLLEKKNRCIRIKYNSDFHMDILPGCMITTENSRVMIPNDKRLVEWTRTDPKKYAAWFKEISEKHKPDFMLTLRREMLVKAEVHTEELPPLLYVKTPLQRTVQLVKRYRDLYYAHKDPEKSPAISSIVLTTLLAKSYNDELSIQAAIKNAALTMSKMANDYKSKGIRFAIYNPIDLYPDKDKRENFTDSWTDKHYNSFVDFALDFEKRFNLFLYNSTNQDNYRSLFGDGYYSEHVQALVKIEEALKGNSRLAALAAGAAKTDSFGNINIQIGRSNDSHGFYAES